jgi:hypothetical protein
MPRELRQGLPVDSMAGVHNYPLQAKEPEWPAFPVQEDEMTVKLNAVYSSGDLYAAAVCQVDVEHAALQPSRIYLLEGA